MLLYAFYLHKGARLQKAERTGTKAMFDNLEIDGAKIFNPPVP